MKVCLKRKRLAKELARSNLSLNRWGQIMGLSKGHLSLLLSGKRRYPSPETRRKLLKALSLEFDDLFELIEESDAPAKSPPRTAPPTPEAPSSKTRRLRSVEVRPRSKGDGFMSSIAQDFKFALRGLLKRPAFAYAAILTLALGIGAGTTIFSAADAVLIEPLPFGQPDRLAMVAVSMQNLGRLAHLSRSEYSDLRQRSRTFDQIAAHEPWVMNWTGDEEPQALSAGVVTDNFFTVLGVELPLGRPFSAAESARGAEPVVILSHAFWQKRFAGSADALGSTLNLENVDYEIVGVMPAKFGITNSQLAFLEASDIWMPLPIDPRRMSRGNRFSRVVSRLAPGADFDQAQRELTDLASRMAEEHPRFYLGKGFDLRVLPIAEEVKKDARPALLALLGASGFLLLLISANLGNLQLARAESRRDEISLRLALGAGRWRLLQQFLAEGLIVAGAGGFLGALLGFWGLEAMRSLHSEVLPRMDEMRIAGRTVAVALATSALCAALFSLAPAWQSWRSASNRPLSGLGRGVAGPRSSRFRSWLVIAEVALALLLAVGSALMMRSFIQLVSVDPGFRPEQVLTLRLLLPEDGYGERQAEVDYYQRVIEEVRNLPDVTSAGVVSRLPLHWGWSGGVTVEGRQDAPFEGTMELARRHIEGEYFAAMGIPLILGRVFDERDRAETAPVAIIDDRLAQRLWPEEDPIGKRLKRGGPQSNRPWRTIVGVVKHVKLRGLGTESREQVYFPLSQQPDRTNGLFVAVRFSRGDPQGLYAQVRQAVWSIDPRIPFSEVQTMQERLASSLAPERFSLALFAAFAGLGLALGGLGVFGVASYSVSQRRREIGVRMAMGAARRDIMRLVLRDGMGKAIAGLALGLGASLAATRLISSLLFGVSPYDPLALTAAALVLGITALGACLLPARRATQVDPATVLKSD